MPERLLGQATQAADHVVPNEAAGMSRSWNRFLTKHYGEQYLYLDKAPLMDTCMSLPLATNFLFENSFLSIEELPLSCFADFWGSK